MSQYKYLEITPLENVLRAPASERVPFGSMLEARAILQELVDATFSQMGFGILDKPKTFCEETDVIPSGQSRAIQGSITAFLRRDSAGVFHAGFTVVYPEFPEDAARNQQGFADTSKWGTSWDGPVDSKTVDLKVKAGSGAQYVIDVRDVPRKKPGVEISASPLAERVRVAVEEVVSNWPSEGTRTFTLQMPKTLSGGSRAKLIDVLLYCKLWAELRKGSLCEGIWSFNPHYVDSVCHQDGNLFTEAWFEVNWAGQISPGLLVVGVPYDLSEGYLVSNYSYEYLQRVTGVVAEKGMLVSGFEKVRCGSIKKLTARVRNLSDNPLKDLFLTPESSNGDLVELLRKVGWGTLFKGRTLGVLESKRGKKVPVVDLF